MFFNCVFLIPASMALTPLPLLATASFSKRFCAPFLARCSSCLAIVASVRLEEGTILTGFLCRGLFLSPAILLGVEGDGEAGELEESWSSAVDYSGVCSLAPALSRDLPTTAPPETEPRGRGK